MKGKMNLQKSVIIGILIVFSAMAKADTLYSYTGNDFTYAESPYTTSDSITGSFTTSVPLADDLSLVTITPISYSFTDGVQTITDLTNTNPDPFFDISTDSSGNIIQWEIDPGTATGNFIQFDYVLGYTTDNYVRYGFNEAYNNEEGNWSSSVPEPSGGVLMGIGLLGLGFIVRRRANRMKPAVSEAALV